MLVLDRRLRSAACARLREYVARRAACLLDSNFYSLLLVNGKLRRPAPRLSRPPARASPEVRLRLLRHWLPLPGHGDISDTPCARPTRPQSRSSAKKKRSSHLAVPSRQRASNGRDARGSGSSQQRRQQEHARLGQLAPQQRRRPALSVESPRAKQSVSPGNYYKL